LKFSTAIPFFLVWMKDERNYSEKTVSLYQLFLNRFELYNKDSDIGDVTNTKLEEYLVFVRTSGNCKNENKKWEDEEDGIAGIKNELDKGGQNVAIQSASSSTVRNHFKAIHLFYTWASSEFPKIKRPDNGLVVAPGNSNVSVPFSNKEIQILLKFLDDKSLVTTKNRKPFYVRRRTVLRDTALILLFLSTGLTAEEVCMLTIENLHIKNKMIIFKMEIYKPNNPQPEIVTRYIPVSGEALWAILKYIESRGETNQFALLFVGERGEPYPPNAIRCLFQDLSVRTGIGDITPTRFRTTFAVVFLANHGDRYTLSDILGLNRENTQVIKKYKDQIDGYIRHNQKSEAPVASWLDDLVNSAKGQNGSSKSR
jgi:site-specific recombinase XerD